MNRKKIVKPAYFPFTYIPRSTADILFACFKEITLYGFSDSTIHEDLKKWSAKNRLDIRIPVVMDMSQMISILNDYRSWAELHRWDILAYLKGHRDIIPFFDDVATSQIVKDIKVQEEKSSSENTHISGEINPSDCPFFLYISEIYDIQAEEMSNTLDHFESLEREFISNLREDDDGLFKDISNNAFGIPTDVGRSMTPERIKSWVWMMAHDPDTPELYITSSPSVIDFLLDQAPSMEKILQLHTQRDYPSSVSHSENDWQWHDHFQHYIKQLIKGEKPAASDAPGPIPLDTGTVQPFSLSLFLAAGQKPCDFFSQLAGFSIPFQGIPSDPTKPKNTLVGLIHEERQT